MNCLHKYGMREHGCSIGKQPMDFVKCEDDPTGKYYNILTYDRELSAEEIEQYGFDKLPTKVWQLNTVYLTQ